MYRAECEKILRETNIDIELHHIGSTSIEGLSSKNCIDILGVVDNFDIGKKLINPLENLGFIYKGEYGIVERHYFSKPLNPKTHLHICPLGHEQIERHLHFVRVMSSSSNLVAELNELKAKFVENFPQEIYQLEKKFYYEKILAIKL